MRGLLEHVRHQRLAPAVTAGLLVALCLLGGLRVGDEHAGRAAERPAVLQARLHAERQQLAALQVQATAAERAAASARQQAARAALAAHLAGRPAAGLLPSGMRFVCADRSAGRCVVIADTGHRTTRLVWPLTRPAWAVPLGLPPGACGLRSQLWAAGVGCR